MSFNEYWKEKAAKRRKTWVARDKRYASRHNKLEYIRREVFQELDERKLETYLKPHYTEKNPIVCWKSDKFSFSEASLREALISEGADMTYFKMEQSKRPIHGKSDVEEEKARRSSDLFPGTLDYTIYWWLEKIYELSSEVETVLLTYKGVTMMINRYSKSNVPFGYYEVIPCHHLACSALKLQETTFHTLNIATLLMEMAAEWELRNEELNYHAKRLKLRALEAVVCDRIDFELWDDKKIETKVKEYFKKDYSLKEMYQAILRPWIIGVEKFMEAITTRDISDGALEFHYHSSQGFEDFVEQKLRPYLNSQNLGDFRMFIPAHDNHQVIIEYQGWQVSMHCRDYTVVDFYPNVFDPKFIMQSYCDDRLHVHFCKLTISAVANYLRRMPAINEKIDRVVKLVNMKYNELKNKTEK